MKKRKNRHKQHSTIIENTIIEKPEKFQTKNLNPKSYTIIETIIGYYIDVSRETSIKIISYMCI